MFDVLRDVRVVDLTSGAGGAYLTKLFADAGADVVLVEPPGGSALRTVSRMAALPSDVEDGVLFRFLAAGKQAVVGTLADATVLDLVRAQWREAGPDDVAALAATVAQWQQALWRFTTGANVPPADAEYPSLKTR